MTDEDPSTRTLTIAALVILAFIGLGHTLRTQFGISPSVDAVQSWADALGWRAPLAFVGLVTVRQLLLLPAAVLLTAGGVIFGGSFGAALGGTGIVCSAMVNFALARRIGPAMLPGTVGERIRQLSAGGQLPLLISIAIVTAHPVGPMVLGQWAAGTSSVAPSRFFTVIAPTSYLRAGALALFGASLPEWGSPGSIVSTAGLLLLIALPFAFPGVRRRFSAPANPAE